MSDPRGGKDAPLQRPILGHKLLFTDVPCTPWSGHFFPPTVGQVKASFTTGRLNRNGGVLQIDIAPTVPTFSRPGGYSTNVELGVGDPVATFFATSGVRTLNDRVPRSGHLDVT